MAITSTDILLKYSNSAATTGNTTDAYNHLGGYMSKTNVASNSLNNLFSDITGAQNTASQTDYRCIFVFNNHATLTLYNTIAYISAEVAGATTILLAVDNIAATWNALTNSRQASVTANTTSIPNATPALIFSSPTTADTAIVLGDLLPGYCRALWVQRKAGNTTAKNSDGFVLRVSGDTAE